MVPRMPPRAAPRLAASVAICCHLLGSAGLAPAQAASVTLRLQLEVAEVCEVVSLRDGLTLRCTPGTVPPNDPRARPELGAEVRALGPLTLLEVSPQSGAGGLLLRYGPAPQAAGASSTARQLVVFD